MRRVLRAELIRPVRAPFPLAADIREMRETWDSRLAQRAVLLSTLALLIGGIAPAQSETYDVILRNGTIVDGTGAKGYRADIAVRNGFIYRIGDLSGAKAVVDLHVDGLVVAPGFLNIHSHASLKGVRAAVNMLTQGVTTEIMNPDGGGSTDLAKATCRF
jgi:hypothetical protein